LIAAFAIGRQGATPITISAAVPDPPSNPGPAPSPLVPIWLSNLAALGWRSLVVVGLGALLFRLLVQVGMVTSTLILSACVVAAVEPLVREGRGRGWSRAKAAAIGSGIAALAVVGVIVLTALAFVPYIPDLVARIQEGLASLVEQLKTQPISAGAADAIQNVAGETLNWIVDAGASIVSAAASAITVLILSAFLVFYLLLDGDHGWSTVVGSVEGWRRERLTRGGEVALERLGSFVRGSVLLASLNAAAAFVLMVILGLPFAGPLAVVVFFGGLVPYFGLVLAIGAIVLVAIASGATLSALVLLVALIAVNVVVDRVVVPRVMGERVKVHPAVALVAIPVGAAVAGIFGVIFAVPVMVPIVAVSGSLVSVLNQRNPSPGSVGIVPVWLDRIAQWSWRLLIVLAVLIVGIVTVGQMPVIVLPIILAAVLAPTCLPVVRWLESRGVGRRAAALSVVLGATVITGALLWLAFVALVGEMGDIAANAVAGAAQANAGTGGNVAALQSIAASLGSQVGDVVRLVGGSAIVAFVGITLIGLVLAYYLLIDGGRGWTFATGHLSTWRRRRLDEAGERAVGVLGGYMFGTAVVSAFGAATQWLLMTILGLPLALPLAVLSFFLCFIPYIGGFITTGLAFLVTLAVGDQVDIIVMAIFTVVFNIVQGNVLQPLVYGKVASLHPAVVLMAIPAAGAVAGILGMFLVVPFLGVVSVSWQTILGTFGDADTTRAPEVPAGTAAAERPAVAGASANAPPDADRSGQADAPSVATSAPAAEHQAGGGV
jgi:predicted PurR-regulated permease PerM